MSASQEEDADDSAIIVTDMHYLQDFQSTLDRIWISCIVYPNDEEEGETTPNDRFCELMTEAVDEFYNDHAQHPAREVVSGLHNALRIIATSAHSFPPSDKLLADLCLKIYGFCVEILFDASWMSVEDEARASATKEFFNFYCCLSSWSQERFLVLAILSKKPWGHEIMNTVLAGGENTDKAEVDRYLTLEGQFLLEHRLRVLMQDGLYDHALNLAQACTDHPDLGKELIFLETLYLLYFNLGLTDDLQTQVEDHPTIQDVMRVAESMSAYCPEHASNLSKIVLERVWSDRHSSNLLVEEAAEHWLDAILKFCSSDSEVFAESLEDISTLTKDHFHLYNLADLVYKKVGVTATPAIVSICLKALVVPSLSPLDDIIQAAEIDYGNAAVCSLLSDLLEDDMRMQWLCLLAVFFIAPSLKGLSALKDCYHATKESQRPKLTSYQQHDMIKCMDYFIPTSVSLSDDWRTASSVFERHLRNSKVICISLKLPGGNEKRLKLYDKSWHPGRTEFKPMGVRRVKGAFWSLQRCHEGINLLSCTHERQIQPKMKNKRPFKRKNAHECPDTTTGGDDEVSQEWLPCSVVDLEQEVLTEQEFNDQISSDTHIEPSCIGNATASQVSQSLPERPELSMQSETSSSETVSVAEEDGPDLQDAESIEMVDSDNLSNSSREMVENDDLSNSSREMIDNDDLSNSSRHLTSMSSNHELVEQVQLHGEERENPIKAQEIQLNKVPKGSKWLQVDLKKCNIKNEFTVSSAVSASYPESDNSDDPILCESSDTEMYSLTNDLSRSSEQSENEVDLSKENDEQEMLEQKDKEFMPSGKTEKLSVDASRCLGKCLDNDEDAEYSYDCENPVSFKSKVRIVVPRCTQSEIVDLAEEMSADRKSLVQSVLTDVVEAVLVKDGPAEELSFNSLTQDSQGLNKEEQMRNSSHVNEGNKYTPPENQGEPSFQDKSNEVEACRMSLAEGICLQRGGSLMKTSSCTVKLKCFMKQRAKKRYLKNLESWRFSVRERDKERGEDATISTDSIDFDVKSPEREFARLSLNKVPHEGKVASEILNDQNDADNVSFILGERTCDNTKGKQSVSVGSDFRIPWIEEQPETDEQFTLTSECVTRPYPDTSAITSIQDSRRLGDPTWADITGVHEGNCLQVENVVDDKTLNLSENRTESPMLGIEPHPYALEEVRDVELLVSTRDTEVLQQPVALDERETNPINCKNDLEMLSGMEDSCQKSEILDTPTLRDYCVYEEEFQSDEKHVNDASCESGVSKVLTYPEDALDLSSKAIVESIDQTSVEHGEMLTVPETECSNEIRPIERVTIDKVINSLENRTVESHMLGNEPVVEGNSVGLPVVIQETEVTQQPLEINERKEYQTNFSNDLEMFSRIEDSCQKNENSEIPTILDCCVYEEVFHADKTNENDASFESNVTNVFICPDDALDLSRKASEESVVQTAGGNVETPTVLAKDCSNTTKSFDTSQQSNVHAKKSVCSMNLPCNMDRTIAAEGRHSLAEEWRCISSNPKSRGMTKNLDADFDPMSTEKHDKGAFLGNNITDFCNEFLSQMINGQGTQKEYVGVDAQILETEESTESMNNETNVMHLEGDSLIAGDGATQVMQSSNEISEIFLKETCEKVGETPGAGLSSIHDDSLDNLPCDETINLTTTYRTVDNHLQEENAQMHTIEESRNVELPVLIPETEVNNYYVIEEKEQTSRALSRYGLSMQESSDRVEEVDAPVLTDYAADESQDDDDTVEYGENEDSICFVDVDEPSIDPSEVGIGQKMMCSPEKPTLLEKENSNDQGPPFSLQVETIDSQQRVAHLKKSVCCVSLPCNMDRSTSKENPHTLSNDWAFVLENEEINRDSESCTCKVVNTYREPLDKHLDHSSLDKVSDLGATEGNIVSHCNIQDSQCNITDDCSEFRIPWVDEQGSCSIQLEVDEPYLMPPENGIVPNNGDSMMCSGNTYVPSAIGDAAAHQSHQLHLEAPELSMQCINAKTNVQFITRMPDLKKDMLLESSTNESTCSTEDSTIETQDQELLSCSNQRREAEKCKKVEKNSEKPERHCQGEDIVVLASSKHLIPCIDKDATPEQEPYEDGVNLFQEDGIWSNGGVVHDHIPEVKQAAESKKSIKQEFVDIDSWERESRVKKEEDLLCREKKDAHGVMEKLSDHIPSLQKSDDKFPSANENLGIKRESKGDNLVLARSEASGMSTEEKRNNREAEIDGDIKRTPQNFLSDNCKNEPFNTSSLFGKRDAMYGVTYSRTAFRQSPVLKSFTDKPIGQSPSIKRFTSKKSGKGSSDRDTRTFPAINTSKFISKKSMKETQSQLSVGGDQTYQPFMKRHASRKSHKESQQESRKCPVQTTNKFISKKFWVASLRHPSCERATRKTNAHQKATVQRLRSETCERSHLPLQTQPAANKKKSSSSSGTVKSFSCRSQKRSCAEALPPFKLLKLSSTTSAQPSTKPLQKHAEPSRKSVRQEVKRSSTEVHGVMTRRKIKVESKKKR